jgi:hypothetical protein
MSDAINAARAALTLIWPGGAECVECGPGVRVFALDAAEKREAELVEALEAMCGQYLSVRDGKLHHDFMSAGELAFDALGWEDTGHPLDASQLCEVPGCGQAWSCGANGKDDKYHTFCHNHFNEWIAAGHHETQEQADARWTKNLRDSGMSDEEVAAHQEKIRNMHSQWKALQDKMPEAQPLELLAKVVKLDETANRVEALAHETAPSSAAQEFAS